MVILTVMESQLFFSKCILHSTFTTIGSKKESITPNIVNMSDLRLVASCYRISLRIRELLLQEVSTSELLLYIESELLYRK